MGASVFIECVKIIKKGRERNHEKVTKTETEKCKFGWQQTQAPYRHRKHRQDFKKAALTELKGEKSRICCLFWMLIVIGSENKKSLEVVIGATWIGNQSERSRFGLDQSESRISPM